MKKEYLQRLENKNEVQKAMILLNKKLIKYSKVARHATTGNYSVYNFWLDRDATISPKEYNYIKKVLSLA